jgi:hypothetical protein
MEFAVPAVLFLLLHTTNYRMPESNSQATRNSMKSDGNPQIIATRISSSSSSISISTYQQMQSGIACKQNRAMRNKTERRHHISFTASTIFDKGI